MHFYSFREVRTFKRRLFGQAGPAPTCCRSAGPTATCCRRTAHEIGDHKLESPISPVFRNSPKNSCRHCRLGQAESSPTCYRSAGPTATCCCRAGRACTHLLPRVLATNSGTIDSSSRILRIREILRGLTVGIADSGSANAQRGRGAVFVDSIIQRKNRFPAVFAPGNLSDFSKNW